MWDFHLQTGDPTTTLYGFTFNIRNSIDSYGDTMNQAGTGSAPLIINYGTSGSFHRQIIVPLRGIHNHNQAADTTITYQIWGKCHNGSGGIYSWDTWGETEVSESVIFMEYME